MTWLQLFFAFWTFAACIASVFAVDVYRRRTLDPFPRQQAVIVASALGVFLLTRFIAFVL